MPLPGPGTDCTCPYVDAAQYDATTANTTPVAIFVRMLVSFDGSMALADCPPRLNLSRR